MQKIATYLSAACLSLALFFVACDKNEDMTPPGVVYVMNQVNTQNGFAFKITHNTVNNTTDIAGDTIIKFPVRITMPATENVTAKIGVDENFVAEYNKANNTDYVLLSTNFYTIEKSETTIEQGQTKSNDSIVVKLNSKANWAELNNPNLILPLQIASASGKSVQISKNFYMINVFGEMFTISDNIDPMNPELVGDLIDRNDWAIKAVGQYGSNSADLMLDGNVGTAWFTSMYNGAYVELDMKAKHTVNGIRLTPNTLFGIGYNPTKIEVLTSNNGKSWNVIQGTYAGPVPTTGYINIAFKKAISTQYIKLRIIESNGYPFTGIAELNVVGK